MGICHKTEPAPLFFSCLRCEIYCTWLLITLVNKWFISYLRPSNLPRKNCTTPNLSTVNVTIYPSLGSTTSTTFRTLVPQCVSQWSSWINWDNPRSNNKDVETWTTTEKQWFCPYGNVTKINCTTVDGTPYYSSGEIVDCSPDYGLVCNNDDNYPAQCSDYRISYFCQCPGRANNTNIILPCP